MRKKTISLLAVMAFLVCYPALSSAGDDPATPITQQTSSLSQYSIAEFDALPDTEKKNVYLNEPQLLPEGFDPAPYATIFHENN